MSLGFSYYSAAVAAGTGNGVVAGLFVPVSNLPGFLSSEFSESIKDLKAAFSLANKLFTSLNAVTSKLGITVIKASPEGVEADLFNQNFAWSFQFMINWANGEITPVPLPTDNNGKVYLEQGLGTGISFVAAEGGISGAGILIPNSFISGFNGDIPANTNAADARSYIASLVHGVIASLDAHTSLIANTKSNPAAITPSTTYLAATGVQSSDLINRSFISLTYNLTLRLFLNQTTQTFDIAV